MAFECCKGCLKPKRHPGCHDHCPEYLAEKAKHDNQKAQQDQERGIDSGIYQQRCDAVGRALKNGKRGGKR